MIKEETQKTQKLKKMFLNFFKKNIRQKKRDNHSKNKQYTE